MQSFQNTIVTFIFLLFISCGNKKSGTDTGLSLMKYGIPVSLDISADAEVQSGSSSGSSTDVHVKEGSDFHLHIFMTNALTSDLKDLVNKQKEQVMANPFFIKIIEEYPDGFIFEKYKSDESGKCYDFRRILLQSSKEILFQPAITLETGEKEVNRMYNSVK